MSPNGSPTAHIRAVALVLVIGLAAAFTARWFAYPSSFGQFGHFRGDAVREAMNEVEPLHAERAVCAECHEDQAAAHAKDVHHRVQCETCHGPGGRHVDEMNEEPVRRADAADLVVPKKSDNCLMCHRRLAARPSAFPQIDPDAHFRMLHLADADTRCSACHDPHEPLFLDKPLAEARLHPVMNECIDCHKRDMDPAAEMPDGHPVLFACGYCHEDIAADHRSRAHKDLRCGLCHQFYPVSDRAGRIVTHRDPRFCLQCHSDTFKRDDSAPPLIAWPEHREDVAEQGEEDKTCVDCHREAYHVASPRRDAAAADGGAKGGKGP